MTNTSEDKAGEPNQAPPAQPKKSPKYQDTPGGGEIEWAGGLIAPPPAPGDARVNPDDKRGA